MKKINENYFLYSIIFFEFIPISFITQQMDGVLITYAFETGNLKGIEKWYTDAGRHVHGLLIYLIGLVFKLTNISKELLLDSISAVFLILLCFEVKKYSIIYFGLNNKWSTLAAFFTSIFPVWHTLVNFDISQYLISIYFLLFGFRYFVSIKKKNIFIGIVFIILSFNVESNLSFVCGLASISFFFKKIKKNLSFSFFKFFLIFLISFLYYYLRGKYFAPSNIWESYNILTLDTFLNNFTLVKLTNNIFNYFSYILIFIWIPFAYIFHLRLKDRNYFIEFKKKFYINKFENFLVLIILSGFAILPYLLLNKSSSILYLGDFYQRHAFLLAPIYGIFFASLFEKMEYLDFFQRKLNFKYIIIFICINFLLLNYGTYRKLESQLFIKNLVNELKTEELLPKGKIQLISKHFPGDYRSFDINYLMFKVYKVPGWWGNASVTETKIPDPPLLYIQNKIYSEVFIFDQYTYECTSYIHLKNVITKKERFKKFYIFNYKKYYKLDKIIKKC